MKPEFTLKIMQWAGEQRTRKTPFEKGSYRIWPGENIPGVTPHAMAPVSPFTFNAPYAVLDANIQRVIARYFGISTPFNTPDGKNMYQQLAQALLDTERPGAYNEAIIDFSEMICTPHNPLCHQCVQQHDCEAYKHGFTDELPVKEK